MSGPFGSSQWMYNASSGLYGHTIDQSCRFEDAFLTRTHGSAGNRRTWTFSVWVKRGKLGVQQNIYNPHDGGNESQMHFLSDDVFRIYDAGALGLNARTTMKFRDPNAWYHIVVRIDTTNGTAANRVRVYVNGVEQTLSNGGYGTAEPSQNYDTEWNMATLHALGTYATTTANFRYFGYMAEVNMIDGTSLGPDSFGETKNDIWIPKDTSGLTFGTNGFRMKFQDSSALGDDTSGNGTDFASTGLAATDQVPDSPTNNFCLPNPLNKSDDIVFSEGNTKAVFSTFSQSPNGTIGARSGKWYYEVKMDSTHARMGFCESHCPQGDADTSTTFPLYAVYSNGSNGLTVYNSVTAKSSTANSGYTSFSGGDTLGLALDIDNGKFYAHLNGTYYNSGDPANGTGALVTGITAQKGGIFLPYLNVGTSASRTFEFNFGAPSHAISSGNADGNGHGNFEYAVPTGFLSLCTANMPDPVETIDPNKGGSPKDYFNTVLWTGNGTDDTSITGVGFQPDWVWVKPRSEADNHYLQDSVRGVTKQLNTNLTGAETSFTNGVKSFDSDGFTVGTSQWANGNSKTKVAWNWKANGSGSSNTDGAINTTSTSVATHGGFSISTYTGTGSSTTVGHGLGGVPDLIIIKRRNSAREWYVYNSINAGDGYLYLQSTAALNTDSNRHDRIGNGSAYVAPTSTLITLGTSGDVNGSSDTYVMYCFRNIDGFSKIGQYTGNDNADGTFVYTGFRPAFVLIKRTDGTTDWTIHDNKRSPFNLVDDMLRPNLSNAEAVSSTNSFDFVSNGFKTRGTGGTVNSGNLIYMAFAEQPFKYANAR